jgi:hypothetical protein
LEEASKKTDAELEEERLEKEKQDSERRHTDA